MSTEKQPYIKYGQAQGPRDHNYWTLFKDLPDLYEMGLFQNIIVYREEEHSLEFAITAENSKGERAEIGRSSCMKIAAAITDWILGYEHDEEIYDEIDDGFIGVVIT